MWGSGAWGQMFWGGAAVPGLPPAMLVVLMLACFLAGGWFLQPGRRNQRNTFIALLLIAIPLSVGALTLPYTFTNGTIADASQVNANFSALAGAVGPPTCPSGMTQINQALSTLCYASGPTATWEQASAYCNDTFRAHLCSLNQWRDAVCQQGLTNPGRSWTSDVSGAASFATVQGCTGDAVFSQVYTSAGVRATCCAEWPRF